MRAMAWAYGLFGPLDWGDDCDAEMRRMNDLWNKLVEIDHANSAAYRDAITQAMDADLLAERDDLLARLDALKTERKRQHAKVRRRVSTPDTDDAIADIRQQFKAVKERVDQAKISARGQTRERRRALEGARLAAVKAARQNSGCYWGNYNAVINSYDTARQKVLKDGGELRFRRFDGSGRIVNQIQGGVSVAGLFDSERSQVSMRPASAAAWPKPRLHPHAHILTAAIYTRERQPRHVSWPLILDRPFPDGAVIKEVHITRRRRGPRRDDWSVSFSLAVPEPEMTHDGQACGIDIGWRRRNDGIRVATIVNQAGEREFVTCPERIVSGFRHVDDLKAQRDQRVNDIVKTLRQLPWAQAPTVLRDAAVPIRTLPRVSARLLVRLVALWCEMPWERPTLDRLRDVLARDLADWRESAGLSLRLTRARRDHYRCEAKRIADRYGLIGLEKLSIATMSAAEDNPTPEPSRFYRRVAAPGDFIAALRWAAKKAGARVHEHGGKSTWICAECGAEHAPADPAALIVTCPHCSAAWDQDVNAARNLLAAALASAPVTQEDGAALAPVLPTASAGGRWGRTKRAAADYRSARKEADGRKPINEI